MGADHDLSDGLSHGGFESLEAAREYAVRKACPPGKSFPMMFASSGTTRAKRIALGR
jgi:hypothetical protein